MSIIKGDKVMNKASSFNRIEQRDRTARIVLKVFIYAMLTLWGIIVLFPFYWMILTSIKSYGAYSSEYIPKFFTLSPTFENYVEAFTAVLDNL